MAKKVPTPAEALAAELAETRARLVSTVGELEDYIRPANVFARAFDKLSDAVKSDSAESVTERLTAAVSSLNGLVGLFGNKKNN